MRLMAKQYWLILLFALLAWGVFVMPKIRDSLFGRKKKQLMTDYERHSNMTASAIDEMIETRLRIAKKIYNILLITTWGIVLCLVAYTTLIVWTASFYSRW